MKYLKVLILIVFAIKIYNNVYYVYQTNSTINIFIIYSNTDLPPISAMIVDDNITVDIPDILENCIVNLTYNFQGLSGTFNVNSEDLMLSMFNTDPCTDEMLSISPVILGESRAALGVSVRLCEPGKGLSQVLQYVQRYTFNITIL